MVEMAMRVSDEQLVALARVLGEPRLDDFVHRLAQGVALGLLARSGVEEHCPFTPEQQVQERRLGGEGLALPEHICVPVVPVHVDGRVGVLCAAGRSVNPADIEIAVDRRAGGEVEIAQVSNEITLRMPSWACIRSKPRLTSSRESVWEMSGSTSMSPAR